MPYVIDIGDAVSGYVEEVAGDKTPDQIEGDIALAVRDQLNMVVDYVDGLADGDYEREDMRQLWESGHFQVANSVAEADNDPEAALYVELFDAIVGELIARARPTSHPKRIWERKHNLLIVSSEDDVEIKGGY